VPRADVHWTRPKPPQWTLSRHSVRPTAKQTGIFACCRIYPAPPVAGGLQGDLAPCTAIKDAAREAAGLAVESVGNAVSVGLRPAFCA